VLTVAARKVLTLALADISSVYWSAREVSNIMCNAFWTKRTKKYSLL